MGNEKCVQSLVLHPLCPGSVPLWLTIVREHLILAQVEFITL
jgi:hypothetical protein